MATDPELVLKTTKGLDSETFSKVVRVSGKRLIIDSTLVTIDFPDIIQFEIEVFTGKVK